MTKMMPAAMRIAFLLSGLVLLGCGSKVEQSIEKLGGSTEEREQAKMELTLAKRDAIEPLIQALDDVSKSPKVRVDVADVLFRLYLREDDPRILKALIRALNDGDPTVRAGVATALGDMGKDEAAPPLVDALEKEQDDEVTYEILIALESFGMRLTGGFGPEVISKGMDEAARERLVQLLKGRSGVGSQKVQWKAREWLEGIAEKIAQQADQFVLKGDLEQAEERYFEAKERVPDSKNINQKLGRFYFDNGQEEKGLDLLKKYGMVAYAQRLSPLPVIDGVLDDPCWEQMKPIRQFYQCIFNMAAYPTHGKSEAYVGYGQGSLFVAVKGYEESTQGLVAQYRNWDDRVWLDDNVDIYIDANHDYKTFYQIIVNSLGTIFDKEVGGQEEAWNGKYSVATTVEDTFWTCEIEIPFKELRDAQVKKGTLWGFNVARVRIGNASEFGQWVPTYGAALRPGRFGFLFFE